jgi:hypothetical protein
LAEFLNTYEDILRHFSILQKVAKIRKVRPGISRAPTKRYSSQSRLLDFDFIQRPVSDIVPFSKPGYPKSALEKALFCGIAGGNSRI